MVRLSSNPSDFDREKIEDRLIRNFVFQKNFDPNLISKSNMQIYKHVFKLDEGLTKHVGNQKVDYDRRYMVKPPSDPER